MKFDIAIVGAGIVGLATAMNAAKHLSRCSIVVIEKEPRIAFHQTGHNSGVIHSGVYYKPGSMKAANCVAGAKLMKQFCERHAITLEICGKVIVASSEADRSSLAEMFRRGQANGVPSLSLIGRERLKEFEPYAEGVEALHVGSAGITNYGEVATKYAEIVSDLGGTILVNCRVIGVKEKAAEMILETSQGTINAKYIINCAGLFSDRIARMAGVTKGPMIVPFRGEYYRLKEARKYLVNHLVYPVPDARFPFLGVHLTRNVGDQIMAGPNAVLAFAREGYRWSDVSLRDSAEIMSSPQFWKLARTYWRAGIDEMYRSLSKAAFTQALKVLVPALNENDIEPAGAGVRAQALDINGKLIDDFSIIPERRAIHVYNVPSPAATASLVIGYNIVQMAVRCFSLEARIAEPDLF